MSTPIVSHSTKPIISQSATWPGILAVADVTYSAGWGLSPGTVYITSYPQDPSQVIASFGNFTITDGQRTFTLQNCRVSRITGEAGPAGQTWHVEIQDRRWQWLGLGNVGVDANALDMRSKLVPWSIYSPQELAKQCLDAMGEVGYDISDLPTGLVHADGANLDQYLQAGENFAQSLCNPHTTWDHSPPMECLARLADSFGCVVILQHSTNTVRVVKIGNGITQLPNVPCDTIAAGVTLPRIPASVNVAGAPIRFQMRFALEPVGEEWDGKYLPINQLSYAPSIPSDIYVKLAPGQPYQANNRTWISAAPPNFYPVNVEQTPDNIVGATHRLSYTQALQKAQKSIWKKYRIKNVDVSTGKYPIKVPGYDGPIGRRQQIVLQSSQVEQVVPQPRLPGAGNINILINDTNPATYGVLPPYYDGYSRDHPAECFGSICINAGGQVMWPPSGDWNSPIGSEVFVDFDIDPYEQIVTFSDYVYNYAKVIANGIEYNLFNDPGLVLETACLVKDADLGTFVRYEKTLSLGGNAPPQWEIHEDIGVGVIALYYDSKGGGPQNRYQGWKYGNGDIADADGRASYYLQGMALKYQTPQGQHQAPIGIYPLDLDGCVQQVSYSIGPAGPSTHWGLNTEFSVSIPPYFARRRAENLPPDAAAVEANRREAENARLPFIDPNFGKQ